MDETEAALPLPSPPAPESPGQPDPSSAAAPQPFPRWLLSLRALFEVGFVSGLPTQLVIGLVLYLSGVPLLDHDGVPTLQFLAMHSLLDTAAIALLLKAILWLNGESSHAMFVGTRPVRGEILKGLLFVPVVFVIATVVLQGVRLLAPWTHNVTENPLEPYLSSPLDAAIFGVVVILAGGVREELQRAFILRRFEQHLGGIWVGLVFYSLVFAGLHYVQGWDAVAAVGVLGLFWGVLYIRRRSAVMAMANHAGFDLAQVTLGAIAKSLGL